MDFQTGVDKVQIDIQDANPTYLERETAAVNTVEQAITFAIGPPNLFVNSDYVFVAGAANGYLLVDVNNTGTWNAGTDFAITIQGGNNLATFGFDDIISV